MRPDTSASSSRRRKGLFHASLVLAMAGIAAACTPGSAVTPTASATAPTATAPTATAQPGATATASGSAPSSPEATATGASPSPSAPATGTAQPSPTDATASPTASGTSPAPTEPIAGFPVTVTDDEGTEVAIQEEPQRIIGLSPAITETLFALDVEERVVGGTDFDDFPPEAAELPDVATFTGVLIEQVSSLDPDLVIAAGNAFTPANDIARMRELGFTVMVVYAESVDEVLADIELIGTAVGATDAATAITAQMTQRIEEVSAAAADVGDRPRVFYQLGSEPEIYGPAPGSFIADMIELAGGDPITTSDPTVFSIPVEQLVEQDPEVIVVGDAAYGVCPEQVVDRPAWQGMTAVQEGAVRAIDDIVVTRPGPRLGEGLAALAVAIHPDLPISDPPPPPPFCGG